ncbi:MAG: N-acetylmannosamine-6-phosphate 2-epimerase [Ignavibacteria bacterium]|nr:N-acetylmannosamine-6-phosphate 2-epimerase [Ignavibacteria bacterium]
MSPLLQRGLIVSCQAEENGPFDNPESVAAFARAAQIGGAVAVRVRGIENIRAVKKVIQLPIIGITKSVFSNGEVLITATIDDIEAIAQAGGNLAALDATHRVRPNGMDGPSMVVEVKRRVPIPLMADIATFEEGIAASKAGADFIATTLSGYTEYTRKVRLDVPDFDLVGMLAKRLPGQVVAEGRFWTPEQLAYAMRLGAHAVVVGTAISRPIEIVKRFVKAIQI